MRRREPADRFRLNFLKTAEDQLEALPARTAERIRRQLASLTELVALPLAGNAALTRSPRRLFIETAGHRVYYELDGSQRVIQVVEIARAPSPRR
jgi:hypothetical protein